MTNKDFDRVDKYGDRYSRVEKTSIWIRRFTSRMRKNVSSGLWSIVFTPHAERRMQEREIDPDDVMHVLVRGQWKESRLYEKRPNYERHVFHGLDEDDIKMVEVVFVIDGPIVVVTVWSELR